MITALTPEQTAEIPHFVEKYTKIGLNTDRINRETVKPFAIKLYKFLKRTNENPTCVVMNGPIDCWIAVCLLNQFEDQETTLPSKLNDQIFNKISKQIFEQTNIQVKNQINDQIKNLIWPYLDGHYWASYISWIKFYEFIGITFTTDYSIIEESLQFGNIYPLNNFCVISEKPTEIHKNQFGLHKDMAPAVKYADDTKIWALNGVVVPEWLVTTKGTKIDCNEFPKIQNAEVRREFIRKVGVERLCMELKTKVIDKKGDYELHQINLGGTTGVWPYLKMLNPSIGIWHMEAVDKKCTTVEQALNWRNDSELQPVLLT